MSSTHVTQTDGEESDLKMADAIGQIKQAHRHGDGEALERVGLWVVSQGRRLKEGNNE